MGELSQLHPSAQVASVITLGVVICVFLWQFWKTIRES